MAHHTADRVTLARLPSGVPVETTVHTYAGGAGDAPEGDDAGGPHGAAGPTVYVQGAQHGQEVNGAEVLRRVHDRLVEAPLSGRVVAVPVADPLTFDHVSYTTPEPLDSVNANMNRVWPGDPSGTLHERMAARLWEHAGEADAIVDLHTGSPAMLTHVVYQRGAADCRALAAAFGTDLLLAEAAGEDADDEWHDRDFSGKLRVAAAEAGIPSITPELAHNKQLVEPAIETGVTGLLNVLREMGLLAGEPAENGDPLVARNHLGRVTAADSGLFRAEPDVAVGRSVDAGERVGTLYDPASYEVLQELRTDRAGVLYSLAREATVTVGESVLRVAEPIE
jgi:predicted deacylase